MRFKTICIIIALLVLFTTTSSAMIPDDTWIGIDMGAGGYLNNVEAGPTGIILCNSDLSGTYISRNRGLSWSCIGSVQGMNVTHTSGLGFDPTNENIMFIGTERGLFRSQNAGITFTKVIESGFFTDIEISKSNPQIGYAAYMSQNNRADAKIYKTTNNGEAWTRVSVDLPSSGIVIQSLYINPQNPDIIYAHADSGRFVSATKAVYKSTNGGVNWTEVASGTLNGKVFDIVLDPNNFQVMYASGDSLNGVIKSTDGGITWSAPLTSLSGSLHIKANSTVRVLGNWSVQESANGGASWQNMVNGTYRPTSAFLPGNGFAGPSARNCNDMSSDDTYFFRNSCWLWASFDGGKTVNQLWTDEKDDGFFITRGLKNTNPWDIAISEANSNIIYAAFWDMGLWRSLDHGASWQSSNYIPLTGNWTSSVNGNSLQGCGGNSRTVAADPTRENVVWATIGGDQNQTEYLCKSTNYGKFDSWQQSAGLPATSQIYGLSVDYNSSATQRTIYITADGDVYKSTTDGLTWIKKTTGLNVQYTLADRFDSNYVYAGGKGGFYRSTDGGTNFTKVGTSEMTNVNDIKADPNNPTWIYTVCTGTDKGLYRSKDNGTSWTKILTDRYARGIAVDPKNPDNLYFASSSAYDSGGYNSASKGVMISRDGGLTFRSANQGVSWPFAWCIEVDPNDTSYVFAGMNGSGFQMRKFSDVIDAGNPSGRWKTSYSDDFSDSNAPNWTLASGWNIVDGKMRKSVTTYYGSASFVDTYSDFLLETDVSMHDNTANNRYASVRFHTMDSNNFYELYMQNNQVILIRKVGGASVNVATYNYSSQYFLKDSVHHVEIAQIGYTISINIDGENIISWKETDNSKRVLPSGKIEFYGRADCSFDNFKISIPDGEILSNHKLTETGVNLEYYNISKEQGQVLWAGIALYDQNDVLIEFKELPETLLSHRQILKDYSISFEQSGSYVKVFTWNRASEMKPILRADTLYIEGLDF